MAGRMLFDSTDEIPASQISRESCFDETDDTPKLLGTGRYRIVELHPLDSQQWLAKGRKACYDCSLPYRDHTPRSTETDAMSA